MQITQSQMKMIPSAILSACHVIHKQQGVAFLVGGLVHDMIWNTIYPQDIRQNQDYDLEVYGLSEQQLFNLLKTVGRVSLDGKKFAVYNLVLYADPSLKVQVALPRRDRKMTSSEREEYQQQYPERELNDHTAIVTIAVSFMLPKEACFRRETTVKSAIYNPLTNELVDEYGAVQGIERREVGLIEGNERAFPEDPLRVMRVATYLPRYCARATESLKYMSRSVAKDFGGLSFERVFEEFLKMFRYINPGSGLNFLVETDWIRNFPKFDAMIHCFQEPEWHPEGDVFTHSVLAANAASQFVRSDEYKTFRQQTYKDDSQLSEDEISYVVSGAFVHDLGKPETTKLDGGRIRSIGHTSKGGEIVDAMFKRWGIGHDHIRDVWYDANVHHLIHLQAESEKHVKRIVRGYYERARTLAMCDLAIVRYGDHNARPPLEGGFPEDFLRILKTDFQMRTPLGQLEKPFMSGRDIMQILGIPSSKVVGDLKKAVDAQHLAFGFTSLPEAEEWLKVYYAKYREAEKSV